MMPSHLGPPQAKIPRQGVSPLLSLTPGACLVMQPSVKGWALAFIDSLGYGAVKLRENGGTLRIESNVSRAWLLPLMGQTFPSAEVLQAAAQAALRASLATPAPQADMAQRTVTRRPPAAHGAAPHPTRPGPPPALPSLRAAAIATVDHAIRQSPLSGGSLLDSATWLADALDALGSGRLVDITHARQHVAQFTTELRMLAALLHRIYALQARRDGATAPEIAAQVADLMCERLVALPAHGSVLLPGGWGHETQGHAMIYEVRRNSQGGFALRVHNTGAGLPAHANLATPDGTKLKSQIHAGFDRIPYNAWGVPGSPSVPLRALAEALIIPTLEGSKRVGSADIYERILPALGGVPQVGQSPRSEDYITGQRGGSCAYRVLEAVMRTRMPAAYKQVKTEVRASALLAELQSFAATAQPSVSMTEVLREGVRNFKRAAFKGVQRGTLPPGAALHARAITAPMDTALAQTAPISAAGSEVGWQAKIAVLAALAAAPPLPALAGAAPNPTPAPLAPTILRRPALVTPHHVGKLYDMLNAVKLSLACHWTREMRRSVAHVQHLCELLPGPASPIWNTKQAMKLMNALHSIAMLHTANLRHVDSDGNGIASLLFLGALHDRLARCALPNVLDDWTLPWMPAFAALAHPAEQLSSAMAARMTEVHTYFSQHDAKRHLTAPIRDETGEPLRQLTPECGEFNFFAQLLAKIPEVEARLTKVNKARNPSHATKVLWLAMDRNSPLKGVGSLNAIALWRHVFFMLQTEMHLGPDEGRIDDEGVHCIEIPSRWNDNQKYYALNSTMNLTGPARGTPAAQRLRLPLPLETPAPASVLKRASDSENEAYLAGLRAARGDPRLVALLSHARYPALRLHNALLAYEFDITRLKQRDVAHDFVAHLGACGIEGGRVQPLVQSQAAHTPDLANRLQRMFDRTLEAAITSRVDDRLLAVCEALGRAMGNLGDGSQGTAATARLRVTLNHALGRCEPHQRGNVQLLRMACGGQDTASWIETLCAAVAHTQEPLAWAADLPWVHPLATLQVEKLRGKLDLNNSGVRDALHQSLSVALRELVPASEPTAFNAHTCTAMRGEVAVDLATGDCFVAGMPASPSQDIDAWTRRGLRDLLQDDNAPRVMPRNGHWTLPGHDHVRLVSSHQRGDFRKTLVAQRRFDIQGTAAWFEQASERTPRSLFVASLLKRDQDYTLWREHGAAGEPLLLLADANMAPVGFLVGGEGVQEHIGRVPTVHLLHAPGARMMQAPDMAALSQFATRLPPRVYLDAQGQARTLEIPELNESFDFNAAGEACWRRDANFVLDLAAPPRFPQFACSLELRARDGATRTLIPYGSVSLGPPQDAENPYAAPLQWQPPPMPLARASFVCSTSGGKLTCDSPNDNLQLALYHKATGDMHAALACLRQANSFTALDAQGMVTVSDIVAGAQGRFDGRPDALAISCHALVLALTGDEETLVVQSASLALSPENGDGLLTQYLQVRENVHLDLRLTQDDERALLQYLDSPSFTVREAHLAGVPFSKSMNRKRRLPQPETSVTENILRGPAIRPEPLDAKTEIIHANPILLRGMLQWHRRGNMTPDTLKNFQAWLQCIGTQADPETQQLRAQGLQQLAVHAPQTPEFWPLTLSPQTAQAVQVESAAAPVSNAALRAGVMPTQSGLAHALSHFLTTRPEPRVGEPLLQLQLPGAGSVQHELLEELQRAATLQVVQPGRAMRLTAQKVPALAPNIDLHELEGALHSLMQDSGADALYAALEYAANDRPGNNVASALHALGVEGGVRQPITVALMQRCLLREDFAALQTHNPTLNLARLRGLYTDLLAALMARRDEQRLQQALHRLSEAQKATSPAAQQVCIQSLVQVLAQQDAYQVHENPRLLVFEVAAELRLRPDQVKTLQRLSKRHEDDDTYEEWVCQLRMGAGKTQVILPLLALIKADGVNLPMVVVPPALLEVNRQEIARTSENLLSQVAQVFHFERNDDTSSENLQRIYEHFKDAIDQRDYMVTTRGSLQSFTLQYLEILEEGDFERIKAMGDILRLLEEHAVVHVDEADQVLDVRTEVNFSHGKGVPLSLQRSALVHAMFAALLPEDLGLAQNRQVGFQLDASVRARLATRLVPHLPVSHDLRAQAHQYVWQGAEQAPGWLQELAARDMQAADAVVLLKELLHNHLPGSLRRAGGQHYGRVHRDRPCLATPFLRGAPVLGSEFGNPYERLMLTYQSYLHQGQGVSRAEATHVVQDLAHAMALQAQRDRVLQEATPAAAQLRTLAGPGAGRAIDLLANPAALAARIESHLATSVPALLAYIRDIVAPSVTYDANHFSSDAMDFVKNLHCVQGFTGTPWNHRAYDPRLGLHADPEGAIMTSHHLFNANKTRVCSTADSTPAGVLSAVGNLAQVHALVDAGALFKGQTGAAVARALLDHLVAHGTGIQGVLYFQDHATAGKAANQLALLRRGEAKPIEVTGASVDAVRATGLRPEQCFTYYDLAHSTGANIAQPATCTGLITVGEQTLLRDLEQGAMRMRGLPMGQNCVLVVPTHVAQTAGHTVADLYLHGLKNQAQVLEVDKVRAFRQRITSEIKHLCQHRFIHGDPVLAREAYQAVRTLLLNHTEDTPYLSHGASGMRATQEVLTAFCQQTAQQVRAACAELEPMAQLSCVRELLSDLKDYLQSLEDPAWQRLQMSELGALPQQLQSSASPGQNSEREVQREATREVQVEVEDEARLANLTAAAMHKAPTLTPGFVAAMLTAGEIYANNIHATPSLLRTFVGNSRLLKPVSYLLAVETGQRQDYVFCSLHDANDFIAQFDANTVGGAVTLLDLNGQRIRATRTAQPDLTRTAGYHAAMLQRKIFNANINANINGKCDLTQPERQALRAWLDDGDAHQQQRKRTTAKKLQLET